MPAFMTDPLFLAYTALASLSYAIGSIPVGLVLGKAFGLGDIRTIGSGNIGATNALRTGNKTFAICVLLGDALKGVLAIVLARTVFGDILPHGAPIAGLIAMLGHIFPIWLRFKGGKGVATTAGVLLMLHCPSFLACISLWLLCAFLSRISSLSAVLAAIHLPIYALALDRLGFGGGMYAPFFVVLSALVLWTHRANIRRLLHGEESHIKLKK